MSPDVSERSFEETNEATVTQGSPNNALDGASLAGEAVGWFAGRPGGYRKRVPEDYDRGLCLILKISRFHPCHPGQGMERTQAASPAIVRRFLRRLTSELNGGARWTCCARASKTRAATYSWSIFGHRVGSTKNFNGCTPRIVSP